MKFDTILSTCWLIFSTCTNGTFACGKESCEEQIVCPKNQVYRKGVTACRKTCELYGREMICDNDVLMDGCVCDESNNQTTYMAPDVRYNSTNPPPTKKKSSPKTKRTKINNSLPKIKKKRIINEIHDVRNMGPDSQNTSTPPFQKKKKNWKKWRKLKTKISLLFKIIIKKNPQKFVTTQELYIFQSLFLLFLTRVPVYHLSNAPVCSEPLGTNPGRPWPTAAKFCKCLMGDLLFIFWIKLK